MGICGRCGHDEERHWGRGPCGFRIAYVGDDTEWRCPCERFVSLGALIGVRVLVILSFVALLGTLEGLLSTAPR